MTRISSLLIFVLTSLMFVSSCTTEGSQEQNPEESQNKVEVTLFYTREFRKENWKNNTVINMTHLIGPELQIIFDCGTEDFFYTVNCELHKKLSEANISHVFRTSPGSHNWDYWFSNIEYQFEFFKDKFQR